MHTCQVATPAWRRCPRELPKTRCKKFLKITGQARPNSERRLIVFVANSRETQLKVADQVIKARLLGETAFQAGKTCSPKGERDFLKFLLDCGDRKVGQTPVGEAPTLDLLDAWISSWHQTVSGSLNLVHVQQVRPWDPHPRGVFLPFTTLCVVAVIDSRQAWLSSIPCWPRRRPRCHGLRQKAC